MATTKKKARKKTGMINLSTLRRMAKRAFGVDVNVFENNNVGWNMIVRLNVLTRILTQHEDRATARRMLKAALEAALKS